MRGKTTLCTSLAVIASSIAVLGPACFRGARPAASAICQPQPSAALVCVYRNARAGDRADVQLSVDDQVVAPLENDHWAEIAVSPGHHLFAATAASDQIVGEPYKDFDAVAGEVYPIHLAMETYLGAGSHARMTFEYPRIDAARSEISADCEVGARVAAARSSTH